MKSRMKYNIANIIEGDFNAKFWNSNFLKFKMFKYNDNRKPKSSIIYNNGLYINLVKKAIKKIVKDVYSHFNIILHKRNIIASYEKFKSYIIASPKDLYTYKNFIY